MEIIHLYDISEKNFTWDVTEVHPIKEYEENGQKFCEPCEPKEADFWSVYIHVTQLGLICVADVKTEADAYKFESILMAIAANYEPKK